MNDLAESLPIYIRIVEGIKDAILSGQLKEEAQLPSTTYLSKEYKINIATVNKAINLLVDEDLVYKKRGIGMFVKKGAVNTLINERRKVFKERYVKATLVEAKRLNLSVEDLQRIVKEAFDETEKEKQFMKKMILALSTLVAITSFSIVGCNKNIQEPILKNNAIHRDEEFGGAYIDISIDAFNKLGFKYGDSLDLTFSNNVKCEDIGYYSGYYVPAGQELVVAYPGYSYIKYCINYGDDVYTENNFDENTKVTITVNKSGKYKDIEETLCIKYSDDINEYPSKEAFANFREIRTGHLKEGILYRGASPVDDSRKRTTAVDELLEEHNIAYNIDLADKNTEGSKYQVHSYIEGLRNNDKVLFLGMAAAYKTEDFASKMKALFEGILNNDGPYYIHCLEGKDRTGYVCMVIEALCGATYEELIDDYFITYQNYYQIEKGSDKYNIIKEMHIDEMIRFVFGFNKTTNLLMANYLSQVNSYLLEEVKLTEEQIDAVQAKLSK